MCVCVVDCSHYVSRWTIICFELDSGGVVYIYDDILLLLETFSQEGSVCKYRTGRASEWADLIIFFTYNVHLYIYIYI